MKKPQFTPFAAANITAMAMIGCALILVIFLVMSLLGLVHPRKTWITLSSHDLTIVYDGQIHEGSEPYVHGGQLLDGHKIVTQDVIRAKKVGEYENKPEFIIVDETGADVTHYYDIHATWGKIIVVPRAIVLACRGGTKLYDGQPLQSSELTQTGGSLAIADRLVIDGYNELTLPGTIRAAADYRIVSKEGEDVTDQYAITEKFQQLTVEPHIIQIQTGSAEQMYTGAALTCDQWWPESGTLLDGHTMHVLVTGSQTESGFSFNTAQVRFFDQDGRDVSQIYLVNVREGALTVHPMSLHIRTGSMEKIYDGTALTCDEYRITSGKLMDGDHITIRHLPQLSDVGTVENTIAFTVLDSSGKDVTHRYNIQCDYGKLTLQARELRIKTGSSTKVFDGTALIDNTYQILNGQLADGDVLELVCAEIIEIGYTENFVISYSVTRTVDGVLMDVTNNYRISIEYGSLEITAK
jgi:hypothetical protein